MEKQLNIYEAKTRFSELIEKASKGEEFIVARNGKPTARITGIASKKQKPRTLGQLKGKLVIAPDFDAPDPAIERLFLGRSAKR